MPTDLLPATTSTIPMRTNTTAAEKEKDRSSKPRPITSCAACRVRKVKCDRLTPCTACTTRKPPTECTYSTTSEEREAIAAADLIAELRATRNKLQGQLAKSNPNPNSSRGFGSGSAVRSVGCGRDGEGEDAAALEAVYAVLRGSSWEVAKEVVGKIRGGEAVRGVLGEMDGGVER
ncbi:hypothetical protein BJX63DRAFT_385680 [Aspergillus granulosus]|uniref:Zn(2)-C6 fungal-type domain-containing protein n=1 Tax=Aspergillus granulosus TaxID=176169 RepID=A0ABR4HQ76_9EURO